jgi:hypothetical protein
MKNERRAAVNRIVRRVTDPTCRRWLRALLLYGDKDQARPPANGKDLARRRRRRD